MLNYVGKNVFIPFIYFIKSMFYSIFTFVLQQKYFLSFDNDGDDDDDNIDNNDELFLWNRTVKKVR